MTAAERNNGRKRVAIFISGGGSNMETLAKACEAHDWPAKIVAVISDRRTAGGLARARTRGIATHAFERKDFATKQDHEDAILAVLDDIAPDIICLAGYMRLLSGSFIRRHEGKILNIHPSLLPLFPGLNTHQRAIDAGMKIAGCSVHFVTEGMDEGPIIAQAAVPITIDDTAETLAARVLTVEHQIYPLALRLVANGDVAMVDGRVQSRQTTPPADTALFSPQP